MAAYARLKNEFTEDEKYHNLMTWLNYTFHLWSTKSAPDWKKRLKRRRTEGVFMSNCGRVSIRGVFCILTIGFIFGLWIAQGCLRYQWFWIPGTEHQCGWGNSTWYKRVIWIYFRSVKQYHRQDSFLEMGRQMSILLSYIILLIKIVLL